MRFDERLRNGARIYWRNMKRKKKLKTMIIDGAEHDRPMLSLPENHWFVKAQKNIDGKWVDIGDDCKMINIVNHRQCIAELQKIAPNILSLAKQCTQDASFIQEFYQENGDFMILHAMWMRPDDDDPERLESGWMISAVKGNQKHRDKYMKLTEFCRKRIYGDGEPITIPSK